MRLNESGLAYDQLDTRLPFCSRYLRAPVMRTEALSAVLLQLTPISLSPFCGGQPRKHRRYVGPVPSPFPTRSIDQQTSAFKRLAAKLCLMKLRTVVTFAEMQTLLPKLAWAAVRAPPRPERSNSLRRFSSVQRCCSDSKAVSNNASARARRRRPFLGTCRPTVLPLLVPIVSLFTAGYRSTWCCFRRGQLQGQIASRTESTR